MPLYQIDIEKQMSGEFWTNRYHTIGIDLAQATAIGNFIADAEKLFHTVNVAFRTLRVRTATPGDDMYSITPLTGTGAWARDTAGMYPLFNVLRVDFGAFSGRPSRKYYRGTVHEQDVAGGVFDPAYLTVVSNALLPLVEETLYDVDSQVLVTVVPNNNVAMRQLRRGSRRRTEPVLT